MIDKIRARLHEEVGGEPMNIRLYRAEEALKIAVNALNAISSSKHLGYEYNGEGSYGRGVTDGYRCCANITREALALIAAEVRVKT